MLEKRNFSGSSSDHRWTINPQTPQVIIKKVKSEKSTVHELIKIVRDENLALRTKLESVIELNKNLSEQNRELTARLEVLEPKKI